MVSQFINRVVLTPDPAGLKFEKISDAVDDINVAKLKQKEAYDESEFDAEKDKAGFRQFVDSNESSRRFYM
jgi:inositol oxygenase